MDQCKKQKEKQNPEKLAHVVLPTLWWIECHAPVKKRKNYWTQGEKRGSCPGSSLQPTFPTNTSRRQGTQKQQLLPHLTSIFQTLDSCRCCKIFQKLKGKEELSQQLPVNCKEMPLIFLHQKAIFEGT